MSPFPITSNKLIGLARTYIHPLIIIYNEFITNRLINLDRVKYTGQTMSLEEMLNQQYPSANGGIYILNTINVLPVEHIYNLSDGQLENYIYNLSDGQAVSYIYNVSDYVGGVDFIVYVPSAVVFEEIKMRLQIDRYRLAGKIYTIQTY